MGIKVGVKIFLKHLKKTLPKKIDDLTIFKNAEAKGSNLSFYYQVLAPANKLDKKETALNTLADLVLVESRKQTITSRINESQF